MNKSVFMADSMLFVNERERKYPRTREATSGEHSDNFTVRSDNKDNNICLRQ